MVLKGFNQGACRRKGYFSLEELQTDLGDWLRDYNDDRNTLRHAVLRS